MRVASSVIFGVSESCTVVVPWSVCFDEGTMLAHGRETMPVLPPPGPERAAPQAVFGPVLVTSTTRLPSTSHRVMPSYARM